MGNQSSFQSHLDIADIQTNYTYDVKYTDTRFGELKLWKKKDTGERLFQKDFSTNSGKEFEEYISRIKNRIPLLHPNILQIIGYNSKKEDMFCADFYKVSLFFETFETDLEKEIYKRSANKNYYTETELRVLLDSVVAAGAYLQKNEVFIVYLIFFLYINRSLMVISDPSISLSLKIRNTISVIVTYSSRYITQPTLDS